MRQKIMNAIRVGVAVLLLLVLIGGGLYLLRLIERPSRTAVSWPLSESIIYSRHILTEPRPVVIHIVEIFLSPDMEFVVTPPIDPGERHTRAEFTSELAERFDLLVAVNGSHFEPFWSESPWNFYPKRGDPVDVMGLAASGQKLYAENRGEWPKFCFYGQEVRICGANEAREAPHVIAGSRLPVRWGKTNPNMKGPLPAEPLPRTVIGYNQAGTRAWLVTVDGRQKGYSEGLSLFELGDFMMELGAYFALNLDGGGSSTLVAKIDGRWQVLNAPYHTHIPMRERPVANALGITLRRGITASSSAATSSPSP